MTFFCRTKNDKNIYFFEKNYLFLVEKLLTTLCITNQKHIKTIPGPEATNHRRTGGYSQNDYSSNTVFP